MKFFHEAEGAAVGSEYPTAILDFSRYARNAERPVEPRMPNRSAASLRTGRFDLKAEIEQLLSEGRTELAAERLLSAILTADLAATLVDQAMDLRQRETAAFNDTSVLTRREREIAALVASGRTNRAIANELFIAQSTVERHVANMLNKLGFNSRTQIAAWAVRNGVASAA